MRIRNLLLLTGIAVLALCSCSKDREPNFEKKDQKYVKFTGSIEEATISRSSMTSWSAGHAIGVYMKEAGNAILNGVFDEAKNVKYTTTGDGEFTAATVGIQLPADGSNVDFVAYYPYKTTLTGHAYPINVTNQSTLADIDLLYSNNAVNASKTNSTVALNFKHMLSILKLNVTAGDGVSSLSGLTVSINNLKVDGSFDVNAGTVALGSTVATMTPNVTVATAAKSDAILVPGQDLAGAKVVFTLGGKLYEWTPSAKMLESGKKYTYDIQLSLTGLVVLNPNGSIEDWEEGNPGGSEIIITPNENPVFVADKVNVPLAAAINSNDVVQLTTQSDQAWTLSIDASATWLSASPAVGGTGSTAITLTATQANTTASPRTGTVTLTATGGSFTPITITVTQAAGGSIPTPDLVFPGADFEDWNAFLGCLAYPLAHAVQNSTDGRGGSSALKVNATAPTANGYVFTAKTSGSIPAGITKVSFYIKGSTTGGKSLSVNVYVGPGTSMGTDYKCFNLKDCTSDVMLEPTNANDYVGTINTSGAWVKVTLNISSLTVNSTAGQNIFALKVGKDASYDILVDDITFE